MSIGISLIAHGDLPFHNPLTPARVEEVLRMAAPESVLDVGCGPGELLIRAFRASAASGLGLDIEADAIAEARRRAAERAPAAALEFEVRDTRAQPPTGAYDLVACLGSIHAVAGGFHELASLSSRWLLVADGFWRRTPSPEYLEALGGATEDELTDLPGLIARGDASYVAVTTDEEWDRYEWTLIHNLLAAGKRERAERARARWAMPGGRDTLGFALVLYRA